MLKRRTNARSTISPPLCFKLWSFIVFQLKRVRALMSQNEKKLEFQQDFGKCLAVFNDRCHLTIQLV